MSSTLQIPLTRVGIVGGGQLARMMAEASSALGLIVTVLDPTPACPAHEFAAQIEGEFDDAAKLAELAQVSDVVTLDIEAVNAAGLAALERNGVKVAPSSTVLGIIQDKLRQKEFLREHQLPTADFQALGSARARDLAAFGLPCVVKARRHGYDGRGVKVVRTLADLADLPNGPCLVEHKVEIAKELAVMVARNWQGEIATYPVVEADFDPRANILDVIRAPAAVSADVAAHCGALAETLVTRLEGIGIFGIEFFLDTTGRVLINEISPRPHNSGHYTIEACVTSQFAQHLRAVTGMSLGATALLHPAASFNLLGEPGAKGVPAYSGLQAAATAGAAIHLYGKRQVQPFRKMGHITITGVSVAAAMQTANELRRIVKVRGNPA